MPAARTLSWTGAKDGDFTDAANWNDVTDGLNPATVAPQATDTAQFIAGGGTITGSGAVSTLTFGGAASWTLDAGAAFTPTAGVDIGASGGGGLMLSGGAAVASQGTVDVVSGTGGNAAVLSVSGAGSAWTSNGELVVGQLGSAGALIVQNHGSLISGVGGTVGKGLVIADSGGSGSVSVTGIGSRLNNAGQFVIGNSGLGSLMIGAGGAVQTTRPGATLATPSADIAAGTGSDGSSVSVNGTGSTWQVFGPLVVGGAGFGSLAVSAGGTVTADQLDEGEFATGAAGVSVIGKGSSMRLTGQLTVGDGASAELSILNGGTVTAVNASIATHRGATGNVDIEGVGSHLDIANDLTIGVAGVGVLTLGAGTELTVVNNLVVGANGVLNQFGGVIDPSTITIVAGGRQGGHGTTTASVEISNAGTLFASSGIETVNTPLITAPSGKSGVLEIDAGGDLVLNAASVDATQSVTFTDGTGILTIGTIGGFGGTIASVTAGDEIIVQGTSIASDSFDPATHVLTLFDAGNATIGALQLGALVNGATLLANGTGGIGVAPCFVAGTRISTERGEVAVEDLRIGDRVQVVAQRPLPGPLPRSRGRLGRGPAQPVIWIGHRTVDCARHPQPRKVWPVRIEAGAFGPGRPLRELWLSPDHALYIGDVLIPVKHLINGGSIAQVAIDEVTYYHVELPRHAVVLAEGLAAESYLDTGDRSNFANPNGAIALYPDFASRIWDAAGCAPLVVTGAELEAAQGWVNTVALMSQHSALPKAMAG
jgi:collagen type I alpha